MSPGGGRDPSRGLVHHLGRLMRVVTVQSKIL